MQSPVKIWRNQKKITNLLGRSGKILSWTIIRTPPAQFMDQAPYPVVLVSLDDGTRITAQFVDGRANQFKKGQRVVTVVRRVMSPNPDGIIPYGIKVKPL